MRSAWFLLFSVALASGLVGCLSAARDGVAGAWLESGDGFLFWFTWSEDLGKRRLLMALAAALGLVVLAAGARRWRWFRPAESIVALFGRPVAAGLAIALAMLPLGVVRAFGPDTEGRPSVVVILLDTIRLDHVGWAGSERQLTPRLDALAARGASFQQAISPSSWTKPAVGSLLTGLVPSRHLAVGRPTLNWYPDLPRDRRTLAEAFAGAGYFTAAISSNPNIDDRTGFRQGFHEFWQDTSLRAEAILAGGRDYLEARGDRPAFLYLHLNDAHYPYRAPDPWYGSLSDPEGRVRLDGAAKSAFRRGELEWSPEQMQGMMDAYAEEILCLDERVGAFVEELLAEQEDLIVVILSDHGEEFLDHGDIGHGHTLHDELLRVPMQFAWGEGIGLEPRHVESQVSTLDLVPTLLELAGLGWPGGAAALDGRSLVPLLHGPGPDRPVFSETESLGSPRSGRAGPLRSWRRPDAKLVVSDPWSEQAGRQWLFELEQDPAERENRAGERPGLREELRAEMEASGWLIEKEPLSAAGLAELGEARAELAELGYVDDEAGAAADAEPVFLPGTVPWWSPPDQD